MSRFFITLKIIPIALAIVSMLAVSACRSKFSQGLKTSAATGNPLAVTLSDATISLTGTGNVETPYTFDLNYDSTVEVQFAGFLEKDTDPTLPRKAECAPALVWATLDELGRKLNVAPTKEAADQAFQFVCHITHPTFVRQSTTYFLINVSTPPPPLGTASLTIGTPADGTTILNSQQVGSYKVAGTCSENGEAVTIKFTDSQNKTLSSGITCKDNLWQSTADLSDLSDGEVNLTADHQGKLNAAPTASQSLTIRASVPEVSIQLTADTIFGFASRNSVSLTGECTGNAGNVSVSMTDGASETVTSEPECSSSAWSTTLDLSSFAEGAPFTASASQTDTFGNMSAAESVAGAIGLAAPTVFAVGVATAGTLPLSWTDNSSVETGYRIEVSPDGSNSWTELTTTAANATNYTHSSLPQNTSRYYRIKAISAGSESPIASTNGTTVAAKINDVTAALGDGTYPLSTVVDLTVTFSESVTVSGGVPTIALETGSSDQSASYISGSPGTALVFRYTVQSGDDSSDLDVHDSPNQLALNGATILTTSEGVAVSRDIPTGVETGALAANKALVIDGAAPVLAQPTLSSLPEGLLTTEIKLSWTAATDNLTAANLLEYRVVRSSSNNISNLADANTNGTEIQAFTADLTDFTDTGLTAGTTYYYNVIVKDALGHESAYTSLAVTTVSFGAGDGTTLGTAYEIGTLNQLNAARECNTCFYKIVADIDASSTATWNGGLGWAPLFQSTVYTAGTFDGQNYTISGLTLARDEQYLGLMGQVGPAVTIQNLRFDSASISYTGSTANRPTGVLGGWVNATVTNVHVSNSTVVGYNRTGGLAGLVYGDWTNVSFRGSITSTGSTQTGGIAAVHISANDLTIKGCYVGGTITSPASAVGGVLGYKGELDGILTIENCIVNLDISTTSNSALLVGHIRTSAAGAVNLSHNITNGSLKGTSFRNAGHLGWNELNHGNVTIEHSINTASVQGSYTLAGIVAKMSSSVVRKNINSGSIYGTSTTTTNRVAGIASHISSGSNPIVSHNLSAGRLGSNKTTAGGIVGDMEIAGTIDNNFATGQIWVDGTAVAGGVIANLEVAQNSFSDNFYISHANSAADCAGYHYTPTSSFTGTGCEVSPSGHFEDPPVIAFAKPIASGRKVALSDQSAYTLWGDCDLTKHGNDVVVSVVDVNTLTESVTTTCEGGAWKVSTLDLSAMAQGDLTATAELDNGSCTLGTDCPTSTVTLDKDTAFCAANNTDNGDGFADGDGTLGDPWIICTIDQLNRINSKLANAPPQYFDLKNNLHLTSEHTPIGNDNSSNCTSRFCDHFDGKGFIIRDVVITDSSSQFNALFGYVDSPSSVKNLQVEDVAIVGADFTAGVFGRAAGATIENISVSGSISSTNPVSGGLVGSLYTGTTLTDSVSYVNATSSSYRIGSLVGEGWRASISNSQSYGHVTSASTAIGGISGIFQGSTMDSNTSYSHVIGTSGLGSLAGITAAGTSAADTIVTNNYSLGSVIAMAPGSQWGIGGLVGGAYYNAGNRNVSITNNYTEGNIIGNSDTNDLGGLVGYLSGVGADTVTIDNSFATGRLFRSSATTFGGVTGLKENGAASIITRGYFFDHGDGWSGVGIDDNAGTTAIFSSTDPTFFQASSAYPLSTFNFNDGVGGGSTDKWAGFDLTGRPRLAAEASSLDLPAMPLNFVATANSANQLDLTWNDNASNETGYMIERSEDFGTTWSFVTTTAANATSYNDAGLLSSTNYSYRISARHANGWSGHRTAAASTLP